MSNAIRDIERAIDALTPQELSELYSWHDQHHPQPIDARVEFDLAAGRLDKASGRALGDEMDGCVRSLQSMSHRAAGTTRL